MVRGIVSLLPESAKIRIRHLRSRWTRWRFGKKGMPGILCNEKFRFKLGYQPYNGSGTQFWEDDQLFQRTFYEAIRPGDTVLDVGAFIGYYTLLASRRVGPTGLVVAIEPMPMAYRILIEHLFLNDLLGRVLACPFAAGKDQGFIKIYFQEHDPIRGHNSGNVSCFHQKGLLENLTDKIVPCVALGTFLEGLGLMPNVIKIDIEGSEIQVLRSLRLILEGDARIFCELHPHLWSDPMVQFSILRSLLSDTGRSIVTLRGKPVSEYSYGPVLLKKCGSN